MQLRFIKTEYIAMFVLSAIIFSEINIDGKLYFAAVAAIWFLLLSRYRISYNVNFFIKDLWLAIINFGIYAGIKFISKN